MEYYVAPPPSPCNHLIQKTGTVLQVFLFLRERREWNMLLIMLVSLRDFMNSLQDKFFHELEIWLSCLNRKVPSSLKYFRPLQKYVPAIEFCHHFPCNSLKTNNKARPWHEISARAFFKSIRGGGWGVVVERIKFLCHHTGFIFSCIL